MVTNRSLQIDPQLLPAYRRMGFYNLIAGDTTGTERMYLKAYDVCRDLESLESIYKDLEEIGHTLQDKKPGPQQSGLIEKLASLRRVSDRFRHRLLIRK